MAQTNSAPDDEASTEAPETASQDAPPSGPPAEAAEPTTAGRVAELVGGIQTEGEALRKLATALGPLGRESSYQELGSLDKSIERIAARVSDMGSAVPAGALEAANQALELARADAQERRRKMRENLAGELRAACEGRKLGMRVLRREEPVELRIPPFGVIIDREKGTAELRFARMALATVPAEATAIVEAHQQALRGLGAQKDLDGKAFFQACHKAWSAARAAAGSAGGGGERVEILDFLPYLALQLQAPAFQVEPSERNYRGYSRVQFAWDVLRLRRGAGFSQDGWRLNLGVATGTTAQQKKRVIWFEDENGDGEFKLTVFFSRTEGDA